MKNFLLFLVLILTADLAFPQGDAPLIIKNQGNTTKNAAPSMYAPNATSTKVTGGVLLETGNDNLLINPSFEHPTPTTGWTVSATSSTVLGPPSVKGNYALAANSTASVISVTQDSTIAASRFAGGVPGIASCWVDTTFTTTATTLCPRKAGSNLTTCTTIPAGTPWAEYAVPFTMGTTSNGVSVSAASGTNTLYVDGCYVGIRKTSENSVIGPWIDYGVQTIGGVSLTPTKGTATLDKVECRDIGQETECRYRYSQAVAGAAVASGDYLFSLPTGKQFDNNYHAFNTTAGNLVNQAPPGNNSYIQTIGVISNYTGSTGFGEVHAFAYSATQFRLNAKAWYTNALNMSNTQYQLSNSSLHWNFLIRFRNANLAGNFSNYSAFCTSDNACSNTFTAKISAAGVVSDESSDWISGNCSLATSTFTCTLNSAISTVPMTCTASVFDTGATNGTTAYFTSITSSGFVYKTVQDGTANVAKPANIICHKQGADYVARRAIVGTFQGYNSTPGTSNPVVYSAKISATGVVSNEQGDLINGNCTLATNIFTCTFNAGKFSAAPNCIAGINQVMTGANPIAGAYNESTTGVTIQTINATLGTTAYATDLICHGVQ